MQCLHDYNNQSIEDYKKLLRGINKEYFEWHFSLAS